MAPPRKHPPYNKNGEGGRPVKYTRKEIDAFADELTTWMKDPSNVWLKDFCLDRDIDPDLMSTWAQESNRFAGSYRLAKQRQESRLINGGLQSAFNSTIVKFCLANCHGWVDKQETKLSGDAAHPLSFLLQQADGASKDLVNEE